MAESSHSVDDRLDELLTAWEQSMALGNPLSAAAICHDCPELVADLQREIDRLQVVDRFLLSSRNGALVGATQTVNAAGDTGSLPKLPGYEVLEEIGRGGMGVVYKARQQSLGRLVAVKTLAGSRWGQPGFVARLRHEAHALSRINHRHVVQVIDVIETPHSVSLVLEYVEGGSLARRQNGAPLPPKVAAELALTLAGTLAAVHAEGILHRDIKPANVLISLSGEIKVSDFGLAKEVGTTDGLTVTGDVLGSPGYMAPEQALGRTSAIDVRTDVYALGATIYEMLTGRPPFVAGSVVETLDQVRHHEPVAPRLLNPGVPRDLETICLKCLEKEPARRFATADELADELGRFLRGEPIRSRPIAAIDRTLRWCRRRPALAGLVGLSAATAVVIVALLISHQHDLTEYNRNLALANDDLANAAAAAIELQGVAQENERQAKDAERQTKDALYAADMSRAKAAWQDEDTRGMVSLLDRHIPQNGEPDRRGFEWWYLHRQVRLTPRILLDAGSPIYVVCPSPDRRQWAAAGKDAIVRLIDSETFVVVQEIATGQIEVNGVAFAPDRRELATAGDDGTIRIWNLETGSERLKWQAHPGKAFQLLYTPDGRQLVSCGDNPTIRVFDSQSGKTVRALDTHTHENVESLMLADDGRTLASTGGDRTVRIWDLRNGEPKFGYFSWWGSGLGPVVLLPDRNLLIIGNDAGVLQTVDVRSNREIAVVKHHDKLGAMAAHPDGALIAVGDAGGKIRLRKIDSTGNFADDHFQPWQAHQGHVYSLVWSDNGSRLVSAGDDGRVISWSLLAASHELGPDRIMVESANSFCLIPRTRSLITVSRPPHMLVRWNWLRGKREELYSGETGQLGSTLNSVQVSPDGKWLAFQRDGVMHHVFSVDQVFDSSSKETAIHTWFAGGPMRAARFSPDSRTIAVPYHNEATNGNPIDYAVWLLGLPNLERQERIPVARARVVAYAPDGRQLALARDSGIVIWDVSHRLIVWEKPHTDIFDMVFSPDGKLLAAGGGNRLVIIRNADDGALRHQLAGHRTPVSGLAYSPDSATLATASRDGVIKLWHVPTGQEMFELRGPGGTCSGLEFTEDGRHLLALVNAEPGRDEILVFRAAENDPDE